MTVLTTPQINSFTSLIPATNVIHIDTSILKFRLGSVANLYFSFVQIQMLLPVSAWIFFKTELKNNLIYVRFRWQSYRRIYKKRRPHHITICRDESIGYFRMSFCFRPKNAMHRHLYGYISMMHFSFTFHQKLN